MPPGWLSQGSCTQALQLGAVVVFADIKLETLCIDENDIEHRTYYYYRCHVYRGTLAPTYLS